MRYIFGLEKVGEQLFFEVTLFCNSMGQAGKENDIFHEVMSQIFGIQATSNEEFTYSTLLIPQWEALLYVKATPVGPVFDRFRNAVREASLHIRVLLMNNPNIGQPTPNSLYLLESVTPYTAVFSYCQDANYT